jgi:hypothetical protein
MKISEARSLWEEHETEKHLQSDSIVREAIRSVESDGIVFLDEMDKIVEGRGAGSFRSGRVSREGVQRDLLPIIEGSTVSTKHGNVSTDHILFICAGAFHSSKPSDMLAELQGRLPIRVSLKGLTAEDFYRILTEPENNLIRQQTVRGLATGMAPLCCLRCLPCLPRMPNLMGRVDYGPCCINVLVTDSCSAGPSASPCVLHCILCHAGSGMCAAAACVLQHPQQCRRRADSSSHASQDCATALVTCPAYCCRSC